MLTPELTDEHNCVNSVYHHVARIFQCLDEWCDVDPRLRHKFNPTRIWLERQVVIPIEPRKEKQPTPTGPPNDAIINTLLVSMQTLLTKCPTSTMETSSSDED